MRGCPGRCGPYLVGGFGLYVLAGFAAGTARMTGWHEAAVGLVYRLPGGHRTGWSDRSLESLATLLSDTLVEESFELAAAACLLAAVACWRHVAVDDRETVLAA